MTAMLPVTYRLPNWPTGDQTTNLSGVESVGGKDDFNIVIIGAGNINFGSDEGPWNHSYRLEHKIGPRMKVVSIIDPLVNRSEAVKQKKCESFVQSAYKDTRCCPDLEGFSELVKSDKSKHPHLLVVGTPPAFRGSDEPGRDLELKLLKLFPNVPIFVDKPVSAGDVGRAFVVAKAIAQSSSPCSVGYMLRYLKAVQAMKKIIQDNQLTVMATIARYACAYESIRKDFWWDKTQSGGPIIEQGTHFCDLSRYFGGDVDISSVQASSLEWDEEPGKLSKIGVDESKVAPENRIPRVTTANWKYKNGAVGIMTHLAALQGSAYACELEVYCDGYLMKLIDPYNAPVLHVRRPGSDAEEVYDFKDDDPFFSEFSTFIDHIEKVSNPLEVLSSFEDGCKTYELTWAIRKAAEANVASRKK